MDDDRFEFLMRQVSAWIKGNKPIGNTYLEGGAECISEEDLCDYLNSSLSGAELERFEGHLSVCAFCRRLVAIFFQLEKGGGMEFSRISGAGKEKGISRIEEAMNVSIAWVKGKLRLIQTNADYLPAWEALRPILLRGGTQEGLLSLPAFSKTFHDYKVSVSFYKEDEGRCEIHCQVSPLTREEPVTRQGPPTGEEPGISPIRIDLFQGERLLYSSPLKEDKVIFRGIQPGGFKIMVKRGDYQIALVPIEIRGEA